MGRATGQACCAVRSRPTSLMVAGEDGCEPGAPTSPSPARTMLRTRFFLCFSFFFLVRHQIKD